jgi:replicative DNA helicase
VVIFLYPEEAESADGGPVNIACEVAKHRNGPVGRLTLRFARNQGRFDEVRRSGF